MNIIPKVPTFGERFGQALGVGAGAGIESGLAKHQENKKYDEENEAYKQEIGRNLSRDPETRKKEIEYALKGRYDYQKESAKTAAKLAGDQKINKQLATFADKIEESNPDSPIHKTIADIYRTDLPLDQKSKLVKTMTGVDLFRTQQQKRLELDSVLKRYNSRIKEIDTEIKNIANPHSAGKSELEDLKKQRRALRVERDQLLDFRALNGMDGDEEDEEEMEADLEDEDDEEEEGPKPKFDPNNKKHRALAEKLYKKHKDKEKVRKILSKNFKGL